MFIFLYIFFTPDNSSRLFFFSFYYFISFYIFSQEVLNINKFCEVGVKLKILYVRKYKVNSLLPLKRVQFYLLKHIFIWKRKKKFVWLFLCYFKLNFFKHFFFFYFWENKISLCRRKISSTGIFCTKHELKFSIFRVHCLRFCLLFLIRALWEFILIIIFLDGFGMWSFNKILKKIERCICVAFLCLWSVVLMQAKPKVSFLFQFL